MATEPVQPTHADEEFVVRPGVDEGEPKSPHWLGAATPTPHSAPRATVDQPAWSRSPQTPGTSDALRAKPGENPPQVPLDETPAIPVQPLLPEPPQFLEQSAPNTPSISTPRVDLPSDSTPIKPEEHASPLHPQPAKTLSNAASPPVELSQDADPFAVLQESPEHPKVHDPLEVPSPSDLAAENRRPAPAPPTLRDEPRVNASIVTTPVPTQAPMHAPVQPPSHAAQDAATTQRAISAKAPAGATHAGAEFAVPGAPADAESVAASSQASLDYKPGTPLAGKGIRVKTSVPRFSIIARATMRPKSPTVVVQFSRSGKVARAFFVPGEDSGFAEVDGPILDAVYRWSASGKALDELPADNPNARATFRVRWILQ